MISTISAEWSRKARSIRFRSACSSSIRRDSNGGFCTSGQIMSGVAMIEEAKAYWPSAASADVQQSRLLSQTYRTLPRSRERMSGNLCRCACYPNIVDAVAEVVASS